MPVTPRIMGGFFLLATSICAVSALTFLHPGTLLDRIWSFKRAEYASMMTHAVWGGAGFALLALVFAATAWGAFHRRRWGHELAVGVFLVNALADAGRMISGSFAEGALGVVISGAVVVWLTRPGVRALFSN
ncbi:hypothetical protein [Hyphomonas sp.]|uniref:hypothetical protein n=1 Tax=Hyphomonas sp. TaxID=87 RepID=UPI0025BFD9E7|nr:hypothetical protein [Hyphomonas sp.]MBI1399312.1 hypothetical protein [Hyphomonas sp.]